jgi:outer membrane protein assembly factor BamA
VAEKTKYLRVLKNLFFLSLILASCTSPRKYQKNKPFLYKNIIDINGGNFTNEEKNIVKQRLFGQLEDSAQVIIKDLLFVIHYVERPAVYDTAYTYESAKNMIGSMWHLGYYQAKYAVDIDTVKRTVLKRYKLFKWKFEKQQRVTVKYTIEAGNPTLIDTIIYRLKQPDLQLLADSSKQASLLTENTPVNKTNILGEINRLVDLYHNNGYYKISSENLRMRGDTTILSLTTVTDDPFENLRLLAEESEKRNKPTIKLELTVNPATDSIKLQKFYINKVFVYPDYSILDTVNDSKYLEDTLKKRGYYIRYHQKLFSDRFLARNIDFKKGDVFSHDSYAKTVRNFSKMGVWQNVNIQPVESKDSIGKLDMIIQMIPAKKYGFEASIEASYSANSTSNSASALSAGNLLGLSTNLSLQNRNIHKEGIKMTHSLGLGVELNLNSLGSSQAVNSNEVSYTNTISFPRLLGPINLLPKKWVNANNSVSHQSFINFNPSYTKRIDLFNLFSTVVAFGNEWSNRINRKNIIKFPNIEYSYLYNQSDSFINILNENPYLRYSYNTTLVAGSSYGYATTYLSPKHPNWQHTFRGNIEESGLILGALGVFDKQLSSYIKVDGEYIFAITKQKSAKVFRGFIGVGVPFGYGDSATLPFFKQYYEGGANSMRGWPVRGIGPGARPQGSPEDIENDRSGDIRIEANLEYRRDLFQIIPNSLTLKWALFADIGNVWTFRNTTPSLGPSDLQFKFKNLYEQLGVSLGTGFRLDFDYVILRFDFGFRFKRPDILENDGWQLPGITFKNLFSGGEQYRNWRYENYNFSIGLSYPF